MTSRAADCCPRLSPPAPWPDASAATSRRASEPVERPNESAIASMTASPARMLPWQAKLTPVRWPAQRKHSGPVHAAAPPCASTTPTCRWSRPSSLATSRSTTSGAARPCFRSASALAPYPAPADACVASAPTPACAQGTTAPTARNLLATPTPHSSAAASRPTMLNVATSGGRAMKRRQALVPAALAADREGLRDHESQGEDDHHNHRDPGDGVEDAGVDVRPHELLTVHQQQHEDQDERQEHAVCHLGEEENREQRRMRQEHDHTCADDEGGVERIEHRGLPHSAVDSRLEPQSLADI